MNAAIDRLRFYEQSALEQGLELRGSGGDVAKSSGYYHGDVASDNKAPGKNKASKIKKVAPILLIGLLLLVLLLIIAIPIFTIGFFDYALTRAAGILNINAAINKQETSTMQAMLEDGEVASAYAERLAKNGIEVGQMTLAGDFVRTNYYIANLEEMNDVAAEGDFHAQKGDGELALRFKDKIIGAGEFLAEMATNDELYTTYMAATDTTARFWYDSETDEVFAVIGADRNLFSGWQSTGDSAADTEKFNQIVADYVGDATLLSASTVKRQEGDGKFSVFSADVTAENVDNMIDALAKNTTGADADAAAAALLNATNSAAASSRAIKLCVVVETPLQETRAGGSAPVNELLNTLQSSGITESQNFAVMLSGGNDYSMDTNYSYDSVLNKTGEGGENSEIDAVSVAMGSSKKANASIGISLGAAADAEKLKAAGDIVYNNTTTENANELLAGEYGADMILNGCLSIAKQISNQELGASGASEAQVEAYYRDTMDIIARKARAERAVRGPFDISSPYTFLGRIASSLATTMLTNGKGSGALTLARSATQLASKSAKEIAGTATADDGVHELYAMINESCSTVREAYNVPGDFACNAQSILSLDYVSYTLDDWKNDPVVGPQLDANGKIKEDSELAEFISVGMGRMATIGVKNSDTCERYKDLPGNRGVFETISDALTNAVGLYSSCRGIDDEIANGGKYTFSDENPLKDRMIKYAAFVLFDRVNALISEREGSVAQYKKAYYAAHPRDNSLEGRLAAMSGLSADEVKIALRYSAYVAMVRDYDASSRHAFVNQAHYKRKSRLVNDEEVVDGLYYAWCSKSEYGDTRNGIFVV